MRGLSAVDLVADLALGVVDQDLPLTALDEAHGPGDHHDSRRNQERGKGMHRTGAHQLQHPGNGVRESRGDAGEDDDRDAVAQATLGHLLAEPHQEHGARHQRDDGGEAEHQARVDHKSGLRLERDRDAGRLEKREEDRPVARVLGDLALARLALFSELLQLRGHRGHELHDDRGRDIRHDAEREDRKAA